MAENTARLTSAQRRPFVVQFRNAIVCDRDTQVGRRFTTEAAAMAFVSNWDNHPYNNTRVRVAEDRRDGTPVREVYSSAWPGLN